jgi:predicted lysophospholipase L1 biosynthesis ABC-type transport system permease subunit
VGLRDTVIAAAQGLILVAGFALPVATFPDSGIWSGTLGAVVVAVCLFGGLVLSGLLGLLRESRD